jgi:hypothetical protein
MGKSTESPTCRFCGKQHRGTCMDHEARGAISSQLDVTAEVARVAAMSPAEVVAASKERKKKLTAARKAAKSGGSSAVERRPSKPTVEGSTPSPRSKPKRVSTTITDKVNGISHTSVHVPIPAAELANLYAGAVTKKRKPRMTQPSDKPAKPTRGRPKTVADRNAYKAEKEKERRARQKAKS